MRLHVFHRDTRIPDTHTNNETRYAIQVRTYAHTKHAKFRLRARYRRGSRRGLLVEGSTLQAVTAVTSGRHTHRCEGQAVKPGANLARPSAECVLYS